jgi:hypothetical protein
MILNADVIEQVKQLEDYSVNTTFADPPYQLGTKYCINDKGAWDIVGASSDFMGKWSGITPEQWDTFFKELFRATKHGGYCLLFGMEESGALLQYYAVKHGWEITQSLAWYNVQGFPKALDISKGIDKSLGNEREVTHYADVGNFTSSNKNNNLHGYGSGHELKPITKPASELSEKYNGYKGGKKPLKPCLEIIYVFRKPLKNSGIVADVLASETDSTINPACINVDGCRVICDMEKEDLSRGRFSSGGENGLQGEKNFKIRERLPNENGIKTGRYPSQLYVSGFNKELYKGLIELRDKLNAKT